MANAVLLPCYGIQQDYTGEKYREIARAMGVEGVDDMSQEEYRDAAINAVRKLSLDVNIPQNLGEIGVLKKDLPDLAKALWQMSAQAEIHAPCTERTGAGVFMKKAF